MARAGGKDKRDGQPRPASGGGRPVSRAGRGGAGGRRRTSASARSAAAAIARERRQRRISLIRRIAVGLVGAAVVAGVAWAVHAFVARYRDPAAPKAVLAGYHITYDVVDLTDVGTASRREVLVRRPLLLRDTTFAADGHPVSATIVTTDHSYIQQGDKLVDLGQPAPSAVTPDDEFARALPALRRAKLAVPNGKATIVGRPCQIFRIGGPLGQSYTKPTAAEHADICVDAQGLVLQEEWVTSAKPVRRTTATAVSTDPPAVSEFAVPNPGSIEKLPLAAAGRVTLSMPTDRPPTGVTRYWSADRPPWHLRLVARAQTTPLRAVGASLTPGPGALIDAYAKGGAVILLTQQAAAPGGPTDLVARRTVSVPGLGWGVLGVAATGPQLHFTVDGVDLVVQGDVDAAHLIAFAHHIRMHRIKS